MGRVETLDGERELERREDRHAHSMELDALREENAQLRELVIQLSKLVIKNVVERK